MAIILKNIYNTVFQNTVKNLQLYYLNNVLCSRNFSAKIASSDPLPEDVEEDSHEVHEKERLIELERNVSRLNPEHRNLLNDQLPYPEPKAEFHLTVKYRRKMYGKYGSSSAVNPGIMWPTRQDINDRKEYERVAYPLTIQEMVRKELSKREAEEAEILERQKKIGENFKKLDRWIDDLESRRAKKIKVAAEAKAKNDKLVEEVRRHFGYTVDHRDERFQQMLEQKRKEEKRLAKAERKKQRDDMLMQDLMSLAEKQDKE